MNKKVEAQPRPFFPSKISKLFEILYYLWLKVRVTNLFTQGGQDNAFVCVGSLSLTMVEARALKDALYFSEENETE